MTPQFRTKKIKDRWKDFDMDEFFKETDKAGDIIRGDKTNTKDADMKARYHQRQADLIGRGIILSLIAIVLVIIALVIYFN